MVMLFVMRFMNLVSKERAVNSSPIDPLLILKHDPDAKKAQPVRNGAGLFYFAILVPNRKNLALTLFFL